MLNWCYLLCTPIECSMYTRPHFIFKFTENEFKLFRGSIQVWKQVAGCVWSQRCSWSGPIWFDKTNLLFVQIDCHPFFHLEWSQLQFVFSNFFKLISCVNQNLCLPITLSGPLFSYLSDVHLDSHHLLHFWLIHCHHIVVVPLVPSPSKHNRGGFQAGID